MPQAEPTKKPASAKPKAQDARMEILQHAKRLFRDKGFSAVSMNDLVASVGLTKPTIYYHFSDKETLFAEVVVEMMRHGNELLSAGIKRCKTTPEKLARLAEGYFRFSPTSLSTMMRDSNQHLGEPHLKKVLEAHRFYLLQPVENVIETGKQDGTVAANEDPAALALYFVSWIDAMTMLKASHEGRNFDARGCADKMTAIFLSGVAPSGAPDVLSGSEPLQ